MSTIQWFFYFFNQQKSAKKGIFAVEKSADFLKTENVRLL